MERSVPIAWCVFEGVCAYHLFIVGRAFLLLVLLGWGRGLVGGHPVLVCPPLLADLPETSTGGCDGEDAVLGLPMGAAIDHARLAAQVVDEGNEWMFWESRCVRCVDV
jgi:hypothetical protein